MRKLHLLYVLAIFFLVTGCESGMTPVMSSTNDDLAKCSIAESANANSTTVSNYEYFIRLVPQSNGMPYEKLTISQAAPFNLTVRGEFRNANGEERIVIWSIEYGQTETPFYLVPEESFLPLTEERWIITVNNPNGGSQLAKLDTGSIIAAADGRTWPFSSEEIKFKMDSSEHFVYFAN